MNVVKIKDIELDLAKLNRKTYEPPEKVLKYLNDYLHPYEGIELSLRGGWGMEEAVPQFKIPTKRSQNRVLYPKISIHFRKISDYGTSSLLRGAVDGAN